MKPFLVPASLAIVAAVALRLYWPSPAAIQLKLLDMTARNLDLAIDQTTAALVIVRLVRRERVAAAAMLIAEAVVLPLYAIWAAEMLGPGVDHTIKPSLWGGFSLLVIVFALLLATEVTSRRLVSLGQPARSLVGRPASYFRRRVRPAPGETAAA